MPSYTPEEYASLLTKRFSPCFPREDRPRILKDSTDQGTELLELLLPHPQNRRFTASLVAHIKGGLVDFCEVRFGATEVASHLKPEEAPLALEEILSDRIVAVVRYKNRQAYDDRRKSNASPMEWLYQLPDDEAALSAMLERLKKPVSLPERILGRYLGVFEVYRWSESEVIERK